MIHKCKKIIITPFGFQPDYIREIANSFGKIGYLVTVAGSNSHDRGWYLENVKFINMRGDDSAERGILKKIKDLIVYYIKLYNYIIKNRIKIIYDPSIGRPLIIIFNYILLKVLCRKIILTVHNVLPHSEYTLTNHILYLIIYKFLADYLIVHTEYIAEELKKRFEINNSKITIAHHGIYNISVNSSISKTEARSSLGIRNSTFVILIFGQQYPYKGTDIFLNLYIDKIDFDFLVLIRGYGDTNYIEKLITIINNSKNKQRIDYKFEYLNESEMEICFKACDIVCLPYLEGSQSGVLFMSYSFGRPVLATDVGNFKNDIKSDFSGEIFSQGNSYEFVQKIIYMKNNINKYNEEKIKNYSKEKYSWTKFAEIINDKILLNL